MEVKTRCETLYLTVATEKLLRDKLTTDHSTLMINVTKMYRVFLHYTTDPMEENPITLPDTSWPLPSRILRGFE